MVDLPRLERTFQNLQKSVHPDMYASKSAEEQAIARIRSAAASEAYTTLRDPISRAKYVLGMKGVDMESLKLRDQGLLMEIMEEQEAIQEMSLPDLEKKIIEFRQTASKCLNDADALLRDHGDEALSPITSLVIRAQYFDKLARDSDVLLH